MDAPGSTTQLSLHVEPNPSLAQYEDGGELYGSLKISGSLPVLRDLNDGDEVTVTVHGADGEVLTSSAATIAPPAFKPVTVTNIGRVGTERVHTAKLGG